MNTNISTVGMRWYLLRAHHHDEARAAGNLIESGIDSFLPMLSTRRRQQRHSEPLFPRYLFARFDFETSSRLVRFTRGIQDIVNLGGGPAFLDDDAIEALRRRCEAMSTSVERPFERGEQVVIDGGPFEPMLAVVQAQVSAKDRVQVLLTNVGRACLVEMPSGWLMRSTA